MSLKRILSFLLPLVVASFFLYWALRDISWGQVLSSFSDADYIWVLASAFFGLMAYVFRALRWNLLFVPMGHRISSSTALWSLSFGYLMNLTIPRSGELARATALYRSEGVPIDTSFGTIILERVIDLVCMGLCLLIALMVRPQAVSGFWMLVQQGREGTSSGGLWGWVLVVLGG